MPAHPLPPMTTRQAKRNEKRNPVKFKYTASQMRRADRIDELEERRRGLEDKERRRKINKRKRDDQDAKNRELQRKLLREGKISAEDTWGKVTASQPRLNNFFTKRVTRQQSALKQSIPETEKENNPPQVNLESEALRNNRPEAEFDSQEDTLVEKPKAQDATQAAEDIDDADLLELLSPLPVEIISGSDPAPTASPINGLGAHFSRRHLQQNLQPESPSRGCDHSLHLHHSSNMSKQKRKHRELSPDPSTDSQSPFVRPRRRFAIVEDVTAENFEAPASSHEATGDLKAAEYFKGNRAPMRALQPEEIYERSESLTDSGDARTRNDPNRAMSLPAFRRQYAQSRLLDPRYNSSGLDIEADREVMRAMEDMKEGSPTHRPHRRGSVCSELADLSNAILQNAKTLRSPKEFGDLGQDSDADDISSNSQKRSKAFHYGDGTPGHLSTSPSEYNNQLGNGHGAAFTSSPSTDTDEDMDFDDGGIDDDTLASLPLTTNLPFNSRHNTLPGRAFSPGVRTSRRSGRFIDMPVNPVAPPTFTPASTQNKLGAQQLQTNISFNSIDDDDLLAAEKELNERPTPQSSTPSLARSMSTIFPDIQSRYTDAEKNQAPGEGSAVDSRFLKPSIPASRRAASIASVNSHVQPPFSTQDALLEALDLVEQQAAAAAEALRRDHIHDSDIEMESL